MSPAQHRDTIVFQATGLTKRYQMGEVTIEALRGIDLVLREGELVVMLGASGSGKSTLLNILGGLDHASDGQLHYRGQALVGASSAALTRFRRDHVGFVFQFYNLIPSLTARENVAVVTDLAKQAMTPEEARRLRVLAPISGLVMQRQRCCEGPIAAGEAVLTIGNLDALEVVVDLLSSDAVRVEPGMAVRLQSWGGEQALNGQVRRVSPAGFTRVSALGVDEQRVSVHVELLDGPEQWARLGEGYRVQASFVLWSDESVVQVPSSALFRHQGDWHVFVIEQGRARVRAVTRGRSSGLRTGIEAGLSVGETVIVRPSADVADGARVRAQ